MNSLENIHSRSLIKGVSAETSLNAIVQTAEKVLNDKEVALVNFLYVEVAFD